MYVIFLNANKVQIVSRKMAVVLQRGNAMRTVSLDATRTLARALQVNVSASIARTLLVIVLKKIDVEI